MFISGAMLACMLLFSTSTMLQAADKTPSLSSHTYKSLLSIEEMIDAGNTTTALKRLKELLKANTKQPYAQAVILQSLAHAHIDLGDYSTAIPFLKRCLDLQALPDDVQQRSRYNLAQLYMATEKYSPAIKQLEIWFKQVDTPTAEAHMLLGSAHLQLKQYKKAIKPLRKAIELSKRPNESWYQSLLGAHNELKDYKQCVILLRRMVKLFPDRSSYWLQLSGMEMMRKNYAQALAVMELAYLRGHLTAERDLLNLAQLYSLRDAPYKAAQLIEKEIAKGRISAKPKTWEQAANAWYQAKESAQSISALEKAVNKNGNIDLSLRLAHLYLENQRWSEAQERLRRILKGKNTKAQDKAWLLLGVACYESGSLEQAKAAFSKAKKFNKTQKDAEQWLAFLERQD